MVPQKREDIFFSGGASGKKPMLLQIIPHPGARKQPKGNSLGHHSKQRLRSGRVQGQTEAGRGGECHKRALYKL